MMDIFSGKRFTKWAIVILVILNLFTLTMLWIQNNKNKVHPKPLPPRRGPEEIQLFLEKELSLSKEQAWRFRELRQALASEGIQIQHRIRQLKREIMENMFVATFDKSKINSLAAKIGENHAKLEILVFDHFQDLKKTLNPNQKEKFQLLVHELLRMIKESGGPRPDRSHLRHPGPPPYRDRSPDQH